MERLALCFRAKPEKLAEYRKAHDEIWPEITQNLKEAGCREMTIFLRGNHMFLFALIENMEEFNRIRSEEPAVAKWNAYMDELLEAPYDDDESGAFAGMEEIWRFES